MITDKKSDPTRVTLSDLIALNRHAGSLQLRTTHVRSQMSGQYLSRIKGRGMEFDESRPYQPGDDVRNIDWRVTARTGRAYTKMFREERERPVFISVDARAAMFFATQGHFKSVIAGELAALLAWTAHRQGDRIGGEIFSESGHMEFRPRRGQQNVLHLLKKLSTLEAPEAIESASLVDPLQRINRIVHPGSLVCVISDFRGLDNAAGTQLKLIARHSELTLLHVHDPLEHQLPEKGHYRVSFGDRLLDINTANHKFRHNYALRYEQRTSQLQQLSRRYRINLIHCCTDQSPARILRDAIGVKLKAARKRA